MIWEAIVDFVYPKVCAGCGVWGTILCVECLDRLDTVDQICPVCGEGSPMGWTHKPCKTPKGMDGLITIFEYREPVMHSVVDEIKYGFNKELVKIILKDFVFETGITFDLLVPVPLYYYRENWRGFNQAELLAEVVGSQMSNAKTERVLKRVRNTKQQVLMKSREEREKNIKGAFAVDHRFQLSSPPAGETSLRKKKILLVDDVFTSGADMRECTRILKKAGVEVVWGLALAH